MTIQEFFKQEPDLLKKLKKCHTEEEFTVLAEKNGVKIGIDLVADIYNYVKNSKSVSGEVSKDELNEVSGGRSKFQVNSFNVGGREIRLII